MSHEPFTFLYPVYPDRTKAAFVAPNATLIGRVTVGAGASIWYGAVVRGDVEEIIIGERTNVQDGAVLHSDPGYPTLLGADVTVGHRAVVHGATIGRGSLIGIGAIILNGANIGEGSIVAAGAVVTKSVPARSFVMGVPGKVVKQVTNEEAEGFIAHALAYANLGMQHALFNAKKNEMEIEND